MILASLELNYLRSQIRDWVRTLARGEYDTAASMLAAVPGCPVIYSGTTLKSAIGSYSRRWRENGQRDDLLPRITDPDQLSAEGENIVVYTNSSMGDCVIEYDLPIDDEWSDLTAQFIVFRIGDQYALGLYDLHVL